MTTEDRFWSHVIKIDGCWIWTASKRYKGYGAFCWRRDGVLIQGRAHRYSYELHYGTFPDELFVLHKCDNPPCVNPKHLFLGTVLDNNLDMCRKGRHVSGTSKTPVELCKYKKGRDHHNVKIDESVVRQIRMDKEKMSYSNLSLKYGLSLSHLHRIVNRKVWSYVR